MKKYYCISTLTELKEEISLCKSSFSILAGGTDKMVNRFQGNDDAEILLDISQIEELKKINHTDKFLEIGSLVTIEQLSCSESIVRNFPALSKTSCLVASPVIRQSATLGGNLLCDNRCIYYNQSEWWRNAAGNCLKCNGDICIASGGKKKCFAKSVSDFAVILIALEARIELHSKKGIRNVLLESIYSGDGIKPHLINKDEIISHIQIPIKENKSAFQKLRMRNSIDFSSLSVAVNIDSDQQIHIVLGGIDPAPVCVVGHKNDLDKLIMQATKKARIIDNDVFSRDYRKKMIKAYIYQCLKKLE